MIVPTGSCQEDLSRALAVCESLEKEAGERARDAMVAGQLAENSVASAERAERREKEQAVAVSWPRWRGG